MTLTKKAKKTFLSNGKYERASFQQWARRPKVSAQTERRLRMSAQR
jgi:hypothetical protein